MSQDYENAQLPPQNLDAERGVIGSILLMNEAIDEIATMLTPGHFYSLAHSKLFDAIMRLHKNGSRAIDSITVATELERTRDLADVGGVPYIVEVLEAVPHASHVRYYASIVQEEALRRELIHLSRETVRRAYDKTEEVTVTMGQMLERIESMFGRTSGDARHFKDVVASLRLKQKSPPVIQSTGFTALDNMLRGFMDATGGFRQKQLIAVGARPAMGKTGFAMSLLEAAASDGLAAMIMPLEMEGEDLAQRIESQGPLRLEELEGKPIYVEDKHFDIESVCSSIRMANRRKGVKFVIIDYLTLIEVDSRENSAEKTAKITRRLKRLAKELNIPIVILAQLNRDLEKRDNKRPQLSDLRSSGSIEQDADVVMFLYRHEVYHPGEKVGECEVIIAKQRNGPTGTVHIGYLKEQTRFVSRELLPVDTDMTGMFEDKKKPF